MKSQGGWCVDDMRSVKSTRVDGDDICHPDVIPNVVPMPGWHMSSAHHLHVVSTSSTTRSATALHKAYWLPCYVINVTTNIVAFWFHTNVSHTAVADANGTLSKIREVGSEWSLSPPWLMQNVSINHVKYCSGRKPKPVKTPWSMLQQQDNPFCGHALFLYFGHDQKSYSIQKIHHWKASLSKFGC